jgi:hypothetical protein
MEDARNKPEPARVPVLVYLRPAIKEQVERKRDEAGQSRSVWIERLIIKALREGT